jgi:hypothetical protein
LITGFNANAVDEASTALRRRIGDDDKTKRERTTHPKRKIPLQYDCALS